MGYDKTKTVKATTTDGSTIDLVIPQDIPDADRAEWLRELVDLFQTPTQGHWKGACYALVPNSVVTDMSEAMEFVGSIVDATHTGPTHAQLPGERGTLDVPVPKGSTLLFSRGYWAHGF